MNKELLARFEELKSRGFSLDMTRGKPSKEQLDLSMPMLDVLNSKSDMMSKNVDTRNYGALDGIEECKALFAELLGVSSKNVIVFGNSSLNAMYECISDSYIYGVNGNTPWSKLNKVKWLCPVPGYDRHFAILEHLGIEMINIPMTKVGPDMDLVEQYVKDPCVKGIWCVPKYSNPTGITYSNEVVERFAKLKPAAKDFRIYWDNAYLVHDLYEDKKDKLVNIMELVKKYDNEDLVYEFFSTSKISFPGSGVAVLISSKNNLNHIRNDLKYKTISYDKVNELRHVRYFRNSLGLIEQSKKHADILRPKFEYIEKRLKEVDDLISYTSPLGGYFISIYVPNKAKEVIARCKECGLTLTEAGCAYPYHKDPYNSHIRLAPSYMEKDELKIAMDILIIAIQIEAKK